MAALIARKAEFVQSVARLGGEMSGRHQAWLDRDRAAEHSRGLAIEYERFDAAFGEQVPRHLDPDWVRAPKDHLKILFGVDHLPDRKRGRFPRALRP